MSDTAAPPAPPKADPETLAIRARPPRAVRFRRGVIIGASAIGSVSLVAIAWTALKPVAFHHVAASEDLSQPNAQPTSEALNQLPASYADTPKLGEPLPGDLGRPILDRQQQLASQPTGTVCDAAAQAAAAAKERRLAEMRKARESAILFQRDQDTASAQAASASEAAGPAAVPTIAARTPQMPMPDAGRGPNAQERKAAFVSTIDKAGDINPHLLTAAASPYILSAGSVIPASLITGLRSDLPGLVIAQVTERVYDSATGLILLIPQGARLIGSYDSVVAFGQRRALIVWQRIVMPDGSSLKLDNVPATDAAGYAGLEDKVDAHTWSLLKGIALSTLLGVGSELALSGDSDLVRAIRLSTQNSSSRAGDQITSHNLDVQPTITIRPGARVRLVVHRDLALEPWEE